ncbi:unnamed protein product [Protopolystoma xenopodis]|uniref:Uncharacterized protein n=1 Tax=Protopolystoma xenopodis TaxID=117903 RepID=A0A448WEN4_9PLAT|nr:unnamed protein product [Protopolystoma xenopodis]
MADCDNFALLQMSPPNSRSLQMLQGRRFFDTVLSHSGHQVQANAYYHVRLPVDAFYYLTIYAASASFKTSLLSSSSSSFDASSLQNREKRHHNGLSASGDAGNCPNLGAGGLSEIGAFESERDGQSGSGAEADHLECVYRLLIDARRGQSNAVAYPRQTYWWVGCRLLEPTQQALSISGPLRPRLVGKLTKRQTKVCFSLL